MSEEAAIQSTEIPRPVPKHDGESAPFWRALSNGSIELPRCCDCRRFIFYPRSFCPYCCATEVAWESVDGRGKIYTFTIVHKPTHPYFIGRTPYAYGLVELACGVRLTTMLVECELDHLAVGDAVEPVFEAVDRDLTLLHFRPVRGEP